MLTFDMQAVGRALNLTCTKFDYGDVQKWIGACELIVANCIVDLLNYS